MDAMSRHGAGAPDGRSRVEGRRRCRWCGSRIRSAGSSCRGRQCVSTMIDWNSPRWSGAARSSWSPAAPLQRIPRRADVLTVPLEAWWSPRCRPAAVWPRALKLVNSVARLWWRGRDVWAATSPRPCPSRCSVRHFRNPAQQTILTLRSAISPRSRRRRSAGIGTTRSSTHPGHNPDVGDVSGQDQNASATMGQVLTLLRGFAFDADDTPSRMLSRLDAVMQGLEVETPGDRRRRPCRAARRPRARQHPASALEQRRARTPVAARPGRRSHPTRGRA